MVFWPWSKDHLLKNELNLIKNGLELMAKTIRSHPTSPFILPEPIFWTTLIFSKFGPNMDLRFLHVPTSLQVKRPRPKGNKKRMDHPFILYFCQYLTFYIVFTIFFQLFGAKPTFFNYCLIWIVLCISDSKMKDPRLLLFQNKTLISKLEPYPKGISIFDLLCMVNALYRKDRSNHGVI